MLNSSGWRPLRAKLDHRHDTHACYKVTGSSARSLRDMGIHLMVDPVTFRATTVVVGFFGHTGRWIIFDPTTGEQIDSVSRFTYETFIAPTRQIGMCPDTEGVCVAGG